MSDQPTALRILAEAISAVMAAHAPGLTTTDAALDPVAVVAALRGLPGRRTRREAELDLAAVAHLLGAPVTAAAEAVGASPVTVKRTIAAAQAGS